MATEPSEITPGNREQARLTVRRTPRRITPGWC